MGGSQGKREMRGEGPVRSGACDIISERQRQGRGPCWLRRKLMKRVGAFATSSFGILGIDLPAGALPHTLSAAARERLRFLSRNILNSRATRRKNPRQGSCCHPAKRHFSQGPLTFRLPRLETTQEPRRASGKHQQE